jgi:hypothetical protein
MIEQAGGGMDVNVIVQRVRRIFTLDSTVFDEVRMDRHATVSAVIVAVGSIFIFGLGGWLWWTINGPDNSSIGSGELFVKSLLLGSILASALWFAWVGITYVTLTQLFRARADLNELVRVMGFAAAPLALGLLLLLPVLDFSIGLAALALMFGSTLIAVQSATDASPGRALVSVAAGFIVWALVLSLFVSDENFYAPGFFIFDFGPEFLRSY